MEIQRILLTLCGMFIDTIVLFLYFNCYRFKVDSRLSVIGAYTLYFGIHFMFGITEFPFYLKMLCNLGMVMCICYFLYDKMSYYIIGKEALIFILFLGISELMITPIVFGVTGTNDTEIFDDASLPFLWIISMGLSRTIAICLFKIYRKKRIDKYGELNRKEMLILYFPLLVSFLCFLLIGRWMKSFKYRGDTGTFGFIILLICALFCSTVIHMISFEKYIKYRDDTQNFFMQTQKSNLQYEYYKNQVDTYENMRIVYHDLKNHMLVSKLNTGYEEELGDVLDHFNKFSDTGSNILNILLWQKYNEADRLGIEIDSQIEKMDFCYIADQDLCSIAGNLLDNAIEACNDVGESQIREIGVRISRVNEFILIKIKNNCVGSRKRTRNGLFKTTKTESGMHGIGLNSVRQAVEKYDGSYAFDCYDGEFIAKIMIPIPFTQ